MNEPTASAEWLRGDGPSSDVVLSSRVRLARNLAGFNFNSKATLTTRSRIVEVAKRHLTEAQLVSKLVWVDLEQAAAADRHLLVERHLISKQLAKADGPRAVAFSAPDERLAIMVNEEDHLRIQVMRSGLSAREAYANINDVDDRIESHVDYAYSPRFGYLTACPTNV
ncbi:MAG: ATP--guanido phosphotransferase, partial [Planctomycetota bacterium]